MGAEVFTVHGKRLGVTPLSLEGQALTSAVTENRLRVVLSAPGHQERELVLELRGEDAYDVRLSRYDENYFEQRLLSDFASNANQLARELASAQALVIAKRLDEADRVLDGFIKRYPNVAVGLVLRASIAAQRGKPTEAQAFLARARMLDPNDPVLLRTPGPRGSP